MDVIPWFRKQQIEPKMEQADLDVQHDNHQIKAARAFVVLNPVAGFTDAVTTKEAITRFFLEHGWHCDIHETLEDEDLRSLVREKVKQGVDFVIAAGGDGTVSAVVSGMVDSQIPMGILPAGTGNVLARDLSIPFNLESALNVLAEEHTILEMDVMEVANQNTSDYYVLNVSVGVSSILINKTGRKEKRRFGFLAYIYNLFGTLMRPNLHRFLINVDDRLLEINASEVMIANCKFMGFQPQIEGVEIDADDGRLDMFIIRAKTLRDYLDVLTRIIIPRKQDKDAKLNYVDVRKWIEIDTDQLLLVQADGELIGRTPVSVRLKPKALRMIVPLREMEKDTQE